MATFKKSKLILLTLFILIILQCQLTYGGSMHSNPNTKVLKFAGDYNHPPYEYEDGEGNFKGFNIDIMNAIAHVTGIDIEILPMKWKDAVESLVNNEVDGIIGMAQNDTRLKSFKFISPTVINEQVIFVNKDIVHINDLEDLSGLRVAYQKDDYNEDFIAKIPNVIAVPKKGQEECLMALYNGEVDATLGNKLVGIYHLQRNKISESIKVVGGPISTVKYGPVVLKGNDEVYDILEKGFQEIVKNKTYASIYGKWFDEEPVGRRMILDVYKWEITTIVSIIILLLLFLYVNNKSLQKQVLKRTSELELANSELMENQDKIYNLAYYDNITTLPNRLYLVEELNSLYNNIDEASDSFAILSLDLDRFRHINDTLGHNVGDHILRLLGLRLKKVIGEEGILARTGGDEYCILMNNIKDSKEAIKLAKDIIEDFKEPYYMKSHEIYITTSIGICVYPEGGQSPQDLIKNSDLALYKAKDLGGNAFYLYGEEIQSKGLERMTLLNQLRQAVEKDELILYYQPQIHILSGEIIGLEALVRWKHPTRSLLLPGHFIPLAEETGIIIEMGRWILNKACKDGKEFIDQGNDIMISVNISAKQFQHRDFISDVIDAINQSGLNPKNLILEITETTAISDIRLTLSTFDKLEELGVSVDIDDFGTGYSSLNYLNEMNVKGLKIDRTFISDIETNRKNKMISNTIIVLAKELGLKVTAEGVENIEQLSILKEMKCDIAQGFHFSRPIPKNEINKLINIKSPI